MRTWMSPAHDANAGLPLRQASEHEISSVRGADNTTTQSPRITINCGYESAFTYVGAVGYLPSRVVVI